MKRFYITAIADFDFEMDAESKEDAKEIVLSHLKELSLGIEGASSGASSPEVAVDEPEEIEVGVA
jgi:hypothetical protein